MGIGGPAVFAWAIDLGSDKERGQVMGTIYISLEAAIGIGAILSAWIYANNHENFSTAFLVTAAITFMTVPFLILRERRNSKI